MIDRPLVPGRNVGTIIAPTGAASSIVARAWLNVRCDGGAVVKAWFQRSADTDQDPPGAGTGVDTILRHSRRGSWEVPSGCEFIQYQIDSNGFGALAVEQLAK